MLVFDESTIEAAWEVVSALGGNGELYFQCMRSGWQKIEISRIEFSLGKTLPSKAQETRNVLKHGSYAMIDHERIEKLKGYLSDWGDWAEAATVERDRLLRLDAHRRELGDEESGDFLQQRIQSLDDAVLGFEKAKLRITHALGQAEVGLG